VKAGCVFGFFVGGLALAYWLLFLISALGLIGEIYWDGNVSGQFEPGYIASLYLPPVIFVVCAYVAVRNRLKSSIDVED
jgi:hypothetical protein